MMRRSIAYCILTVFCQIVASCLYLENSGYIHPPMWLSLIVDAYFSLVGIMLALIRLSDPLVMSVTRRNFIKFIQKITCRSTGTNQENQYERTSSKIRTSISGTSSSSSDRYSEMRGTMKDGKFIVEETDELADSLNAFLTSSLNVELVYTILTGVSRLIGTPDLESWKNGQVPDSDTNDFSMRLQLDSIKIGKSNLWEKAQ